MWRLTILVLFLSGLPGLTLLSQSNKAGDQAYKPVRVEIPVRSFNETYRIIPCGTNGLILFYRSQEVADASRTKWYFTSYDTNLQQLWVKDVPLFNDQEFRFFQQGKDTLSLLFVHSGKSKSSENSFGILRIIPRRGTMILNTGKIEEDETVDFFGVRSGLAWLGVNNRGQAGKIVHVYLGTGTSRAFALGNGSQISVLWMKPDSTTSTVSAIVKRQVTKKSSEYYMVRYDTSGNIKKEVLITAQTGERSLTQFRVADVGTGAQLLLGSYGQGETRSAQKGKAIETSTGFFSSLIINGTLKSISFYNYLEMQCAASLVGENDIMSLKKKALKKNKPLGEYSLDYSVLLHGILYTHDQQVLAAEIFAPQYHTENFTDFDFYGRPYTNSYSVFDGYRFYNTIAAGFDAEGKLLWDNSMEIRNLVSFDLSARTVVFPSDKNLVMCYESDGKIGSKIIEGNTVVEKLDFSAMELLNPDDKLLSGSKGQMEHWYDDFFLVYGYQDIKNVALESNNKRLVFYFSKLQFEK